MSDYLEIDLVIVFFDEPEPRQQSFLDIWYGQSLADSQAPSL